MTLETNDIIFSKKAAIAFDSLTASQKTVLKKKLKLLQISMNVNRVPHLIKLSNDQKHVIKSGYLRVFCELKDKTLIISDIINKDSLKYLLR